MSPAAVRRERTQRCMWPCPGPVLYHAVLRTDSRQKTPQHSTVFHVCTVLGKALSESAPAVDQKALRESRLRLSVPSASLRCCIALQTSPITDGDIAADRLGSGEKGWSDPERIAVDGGSQLPCRDDTRDAATVSTPEALQHGSRGIRLLVAQACQTEQISLGQPGV